jgi:predicted transcriptional regulator
MSTAPVRATINIDPEVRQKLKEVAVARRTTVRQLTETAILQWCRRQPEYRAVLATKKA